MRILARTLAFAALCGAVQAAPPKDRVPIVIELFTSEGCSSCPPADDLLASLSNHQIRGAEIIVLSEHVDYWDHAGWRDPFSSNVFSSRQQGYGDKFRLASVYTPQMVVDGIAQFNGSDSEEARQAIRGAAQQAKVPVSLIRSGSADDLKTVVTVRVEGLADVRAEQAEVILAITESGLTSQVLRGENSGRLLRHTGVVRSLNRVAAIEARKGAYVADLQVNLARQWKRENLRAVILVQDRKSRRIVGAASCPL